MNHQGLVRRFDVFPTIFRAECSCGWVGAKTHMEQIASQWAEKHVQVEAER